MRSQTAFTEAIEEHLALKRQNSELEQSMPLARYDVGDPLDRYPGASINAIVDQATEVSPAIEEPQVTSPAIPHVGPTAEQAMEAASVLDGGYEGRPLETMNGMTPMLSLVEDIDDTNSNELSKELPAITNTPDLTTTNIAEFPSTTDSSATNNVDVKEQPVIVIDTDEPLEPMEMPSEPSTAAKPNEGGRFKRPRFFGFGKKEKQKDDSETWFSGKSRDFDWD